MNAPRAQGRTPLTEAADDKLLKKRAPDSGPTVRWRVVLCGEAVVGHTERWKPVNTTSGVRTRRSTAHLGAVPPGSSLLLLLPTLRVYVP